MPGGEKLNDKVEVVIIHGTYGKPDSNWFPWLQEELSYIGVTAKIPSFPSHKYQNISSWRAAFKEQVGDLHSNMILVGHSLGAGFLLNLLEDATVPVKASVFVCGFTGKLGLPDYDPQNETFVCRPFDWKKICDHAGRIYVLHGENDPYVPLTRGEELAKNLRSPLTVVPNGLHLNTESGWNSLPLLLQLLKPLLSPSLDQLAPRV